MDFDPIPPASAPDQQSAPAKSPAPNRSSASDRPKEAPAGARRALSSRQRRLLLWLGLPLATVALAGLTGVGVAASINRPQVGEELAGFVPRLVTSLRDSNGEVLAQYKRENRVMLAEGEVPDLFRQAILAAEDSFFFQHGGVDLKGAMRAAVKNVMRQRRSEGASTITMQLARMLFLTREKTWKRKFEEILLAVELEKRFSKQQILTLYCNLINLSHGNYGVEAASRAYFNKSAKDLTLAEAATIAGVPRRPATYRILDNKEAVVRRRNIVLRRMLDEGFIDAELYAATSEEPLLVATPTHEAALGPYFAEEVRRFLADSYGTDTLYDGGLEVQTTLDRDTQRATEAALREGLLQLDHRKGWRGPLEHIEATDLANQRLPAWGEGALQPIPGEWYQGLVLSTEKGTAQVKIGDEVYPLEGPGFQWTRRRLASQLLKPGDVAWFRLQAEEDGALQLMLEQEPELEAAAVVLESATGAVRSMVGGWSFERNEFNRITQAKRQVGSAFKAFVFGAALESGYTPADTLFDGPVVFQGADNQPSYSPRNNSRQYYGVITLRQALERSINVTAVKLLDMVGYEPVIEFARRSGIQADLLPYPSLALGSSDIVPLELAASYAAIANQGVWVEPYFVERVSSQDGRTLFEHLPRAHKAMEPQIACLLTRMMQGVTQRGTASSLARLEVEIAGKTGTTNRYTDAWFVGFTPRLTILVWVGYDQNRSIGAGMTGSRAALPIWESIVERGLEEGWIEVGGTFAQPAGVTEAEVEYNTGLRPGPGATRYIKEVFLEGTEPEMAFNLDWARIVQMPWYQQEPFYLPKEGERMPAQVADWTAVREGWQAKSRR